MQNALFRCIWDSFAVNWSVMGFFLGSFTYSPLIPLSKKVYGAGKGQVIIETLFFGTFHFQLVSEICMQVAGREYAIIKKWQE